ncbi:DUF1772 domain-containing protein (plasmid) [Bosea sp. F3-2]|uniref:DUF1772 domain-containing protein n=1 Tax=Bosea sp. F3-2 TaxID=2599640 RepID=UPI0011EFAECD|nr:DUF1772 domain-containing protein [Bosea sp. F3-2]QEL27100.1 DUF1772 domain-containing protein [Bosea sp. F3-2]
MAIRTIQFLAVIVTALTLIPAGAHLAVLPNKIGLSQADYFTVQGIYRGWAILGWLWPSALLLNSLLAFLVRSQSGSSWLAACAALCFALMLVIFVLWTLPANQTTENWTTVPANWEALRRQWEFSHAANTAIAFVALSLSTLSALSWRPEAP